MRFPLARPRPMAAGRLWVRPTAVTYGFVAAILAVGVQVVFNVQPPSAYGICMACHTRDIVNWILRFAAGVNWEIAPVSIALPLLTPLGVYLGATIAARRNREQRSVSLGHPWRSLILGVLVMNAAIIALGCPTRLLLLGAFGEALGLLGVLGVIAGIVAGTQLLKMGIVE